MPCASSTLEKIIKYGKKMKKSLVQLAFNLLRVPLLPLNYILNIFLAMQVVIYEQLQAFSTADDSSLQWHYVPDLPLFNNNPKLVARSPGLTRQPSFYENLEWKLKHLLYIYFFFITNIAILTYICALFSYYTVYYIYYI